MTDDVGKLERSAAGDISQALLRDGTEGTAGVQCILREIEALEPGAIENEAARLQLRRLERMGRKPN